MLVIADQFNTLIRYSKIIRPRGESPPCLHVIYQTRGRVFHPMSKHREVVEKTRRSRVFFNQLQGVWISDETPFRMFDIASQTINNSWRKSKQKFTRFYDN